MSTAVLHKKKAGMLYCSNISSVNFSRLARVFHWGESAGGEDSGRERHKPAYTHIHTYNLGWGQRSGPLTHTEL